MKKFTAEGISLGDNLSNFFSEKEIKDHIEDTYYHIEDKTFIQSSLYNFSFFKEYKGLDAVIKNNDPNYKVYAIGGTIEYLHPNPFYREIAFDNLFKKQEEIINKYSLLFPDAKKNEKYVRHPGDPTGKSILKYTSLTLESNDTIMVEVCDWSDDVPFKSNLKVGILSEEFNKWLTLNQTLYQRQKLN